MADSTQPQVALPSTKAHVTMVLSCNWQLTVDIRKSETVISEVPAVHGEGVFCVATQNFQLPGESHRVLLFFGGTNLHKLGLKIKGVQVIIVEKYMPANGSYLDMINEADKSLSPQLVFSLELRKGFDGNVMFVHNVLLNFRILVESSTDSLAYSLQDATLKSQLLGACAEGSRWHDVVIEAKDSKKFRAHKAVLAARSPEFAKMFRPSSDEKANSPVQPTSISLDAGSKSVENFLKFIYTGGLEKSSFADQGLLQLATTYQVASLKDVCTKALKTFHGRELGVSIMKMFTREGTALGAQGTTNLVVRNSGYPVGDVSSYYSCEWTIKEVLRDGETLASDMYYYRDSPLFYAFLQVKNEMYHIVLMMNYGIGDFDCEKTYYSWCRTTPDASQTAPENHRIWFELKSEQTKKMTSVRTFLAKFRKESNDLIQLDFLMKLTNKSSDFHYGMVDANWTKEMSACLNGPLADVEIVCGSETFSAHRAILSARSSVFATQFSPNVGSLTEKPGVIVIALEEEPSTFGHFLRFLYTGVIPHLACNEKHTELERLAVKYDVKSLKSWLSNFAIEPRTNPLVSVFFSLSV